MFRVERDPFKSSRAILNKIGNVLSPRTICRRLLGDNLPKRIAWKAHLLTTINVEKSKDFAFAHKNRRKPEDEEKSRKILSNDETKRNLFGNDARNVLRSKG